MVTFPHRKYTHILLFVPPPKMVISAFWLFVVMQLVPFVSPTFRHHRSSPSLSPYHRRPSSDDEDGIISKSGAAGCAVVPPPLWCTCDKLESQCGTAQLCNRYAGAIRDEPLHITLLYESLCPDCQSFITGPLFDVYQKFKAYIRIELVPFGNARVLENGTIKCQHGAEECRINKYHSCAIHFMHEPLPFIYCMEKLISSGVSLEKASKKCYAKLHPIPHIYDQIIHCFHGPTGDQLQKEAGQRTAQIWPDQHEFVPWILVNNASLQSTQFLMNGLPTLICLSRVGIGDDNEPMVAGCEPFTSS